MDENPYKSPESPTFPILNEARPSWKRRLVFATCVLGGGLCGLLATQIWGRGLFIGLVLGNLVGWLAERKMRQAEKRMPPGQS